MVVLPALALSNALCTRYSLLLSRADVASSSSKMSGFLAGYSVMSKGYEQAYALRSTVVPVMGRGVTETGLTCHPVQFWIVGIELC